MTRHQHMPSPLITLSSNSVPAGRAMPLHTRIREELRAHILSGDWQPHDKLPSESALMAQYGVSRITVRQALGDLERERMIFKLPGKGAFVTQTRRFQELGRLRGFGEAMGAQGHETFDKLLSLRTVAASTQVAANLQLAARQPVTEIRRVRHLDREPVSLDVTWVRTDIGEQLARADLARRDIFLILENDCAIALGHADLIIDAVQADSALATQLGIDAGAPVLRIERLTHRLGGAPLDYEHLYCRADNFQYRLRIQRG